MIEFTHLSSTELSSYVIQGRTRDQIIEWKKGDVLDWALESKNLRNSVYPADVVPSENQSTLNNIAAVMLLLRMS